MRLGLAGLNSNCAVTMLRGKGETFKIQKVKYNETSLDWGARARGILNILYTTML